LETSREALERAAARCGIELEYEDTWGRRHTASDEALRSALAILHEPVHSDEALKAALEHADLAQWSRALPPCLVVREDADSIRVHIPSSLRGASLKLELGWENGDLEHHWFWAPELRELDHAMIAGREFVAKRLPLPRTLRLGYHQIRVLWVHDPELEELGTARFIVCPAKVRTPGRRMAGVALSLYGLRSARNWGCGDFTDLSRTVEALAAAGVAFVALNPLHAIANRQPYNTSPYLPECSLYRNFLYLDPEKAPGFDGADVPREEIGELRRTPLVEYERVAQSKLLVLRRAFGRFRAAGDTGAFEDYVSGEGSHLEDYARYCALWAEIHEAYPHIWLWTDWPEPFRDPRSEAVAAWAAARRDDIDFYKFLQWQIDCQLAAAQAHARACGMSIGLYHDLALATDRYGADLWANREFFAMGARVGAPPDELAPSGQDWGFPPPDREAHRRQGYELFAQSIRNNARHGGALRIDHVMRFFRLFWIPDELTPLAGVYVRDYVDDLLNILALESVRGDFIVIGEDLGTVPPGVREKLSEMGILGYRLLWFEKNLDGSFRLPHQYPEWAAVSTTTHDLPTLAGFEAGRDIEARKEAGLVDEFAYQQQWSARRSEIERLTEALERAGCAHDPLKFILTAPCVLAIINQEDLTGETEQQNLPASTWQHPNWRRKMRVNVEEFGRLVWELRARIEDSGRA
jgi:4-alpha-glucanotransferase